MSTNATGKNIDVLLHFKNSFYYSSQVEKEKFRMGNLDSLMHTNDNMIKMEVNFEGLLKKIERQTMDIEPEAKLEPF